MRNIFAVSQHEFSFPEMILADISKAAKDELHTPVVIHLFSHKSGIDLKTDFPFSKTLGND